MILDRLRGLVVGIILINIIFNRRIDIWYDALFVDGSWDFCLFHADNTLKHLSIHL